MTRLAPLLLGLMALLGPGLALELDNLREVVTQLRNRFTPKIQDGKVPIFSLAVRVPADPDSGQFDVSRITDSSEEVKSKILEDCDVYVSHHLTAAVVLQSWGAKHCKSSGAVFGHAESRVLQKFPWKEPEGPELMLFYTSSSPCDGTCTNNNSKHNILGRLKVINKWPSHAVVFSDIFTPNKGPPIPEETLEQSLENLAQSVGRGNIYRCSQRRCRRCFDNKGVVRFCVSDAGSPGRSPVSWSSGGSVRSHSEGKNIGRQRHGRKVPTSQDQNRSSSESRSVQSNSRSRSGSRSGSRSPRKGSRARRGRNRSSRSVQSNSRSRSGSRSGSRSPRRGSRARRGRNRSSRSVQSNSRSRSGSRSPRRGSRARRGRNRSSRSVRSNSRSRSGSRSPRRGSRARRGRNRSSRSVRSNSRSRSGSRSGSRSPRRGSRARRGRNRSSRSVQSNSRSRSGSRSPRRGSRARRGRNRSSRSVRSNSRSRSGSRSGSRSPRRGSRARRGRNRSSRSSRSRSPGRTRRHRSKSPARRRSRAASPRRSWGEEAALMFLQ